MASNRAPASVSVDLDNKWTYMKMHGIEMWDQHDSYLDIVVPRMLDMFQRRGVCSTVFVVGQDAALAANHPLLASIARAGHEIGNHSFHHDTWLHTGTVEQIQQELSRAEAAITQATGVRPRGFRAPGYGLSQTSITALLRLGYAYDASSFPNMLGPAAQMFFNVTSRMSKAERARRKNTFGTMANAVKPLRPYFWIDPDSGQRLLEIPVTSMPVFRTPIHLTYLLYLSQYSTTAAVAYFKSAIALCRLRGIEPSLILHPPDLLGHDDNAGIDFFPGMDLSAEHKVSFVENVLDVLERHFTIVPVEEHAEKAENCPERPPQFRSLQACPGTAPTSLPEVVK